MKNLKIFITAIFVFISMFANATRTLDMNDLDDFIDGSTVMAAGGGGSAKIAKQLVDKYFTESDQVVLNDVTDIKIGEGFKAASVGAIGSPATLFNLEDPLGLPLNAYNGLNITHADGATKRISYLMPIEVGAINGLYAFLLANKVTSSTFPVTVLDVDGGGRSVPTLPLLLYSYFPDVYNQSALVTAPTAKPKGDVDTPSEYALLYAEDGNQGRVETTILAMLSGKDSPYAGAAGYGSFYADADDISKGLPVTGQISVAVDAGKAYKASPTGNSVATSLNNSGRTSKVIFSGKVTGITRDTEGLDLGLITITGSGNNAGDMFTINYENENICAYKHSYSTTTPFVLGPDSVGYVPTNGTMFDNSDLYNIFQGGEMPEVDIVAILTSKQVSDNSGIMAAWADVRKGIPESKCDFPYKTPWLNNDSEAD